MRTWTVVAALAPLLVAAAPLSARQQPAPKPQPAAPAPKPAAPKPAAPAPVPAAAPAPSSAAATRALSRIAARRPELEVTGGVGTALVDLSSWSGETMSDWSKTTYWGAARVFFPVGNTLSVGGELGYHYHFWWSTPSGYSWTYNNSAAAMHAAALVRVPVGTAFTADMGVGFHFFSSVKAGLVAAFSYRIPAGANLVIPVGIRADAILTDPILVPVVLNVGVGFRL